MSDADHHASQRSPDSATPRPGPPPAGWGAQPHPAPNPAGEGLSGQYPPGYGAYTVPAPPPTPWAPPVPPYLPGPGGAPMWQPPVPPVRDRKPWVWVAASAVVIVAVVAGLLVLFARPALRPR